MKTLLLTLFIAGLSHAYLYSTTPGGVKIKWNASAGLNLFIDARDWNSSNISSADTRIAVEEALSQWSGTIPFPVYPVYTEDLPALGTGATFRFSSNPAYFGSGVLAVTSLSYNSSSGSVYSGDILMNDTSFSSRFTNDKSFLAQPKPYVGDVVTHELGHLLGLNHSEVNGSSMIFSVFRGQHSIHSDDVSGVSNLYYGDSDTGIKGTVVATNGVPVFGAHVQLIDLGDNDVVAGVFTEPDGVFAFSGLSPERSYALYVAPMRSKENLPSLFGSVRTDICDGKNFAPAFFSKCGARSAGRAQVIRPEDMEVLDVGLVTVKCSTSFDPNYLRQKVEDNYEPYLLLDYLDGFKTAGTFTGHFSKAEVEQGLSGKGDRLRLDLSGLDVGSMGAGAIRLSFASGMLGTATGAIISIKRADEPASYETFGLDPITGKPALDFSFTRELSTDSDDNVFDLVVYPVELTVEEKSAIFAKPEIMTNKEGIYFLSLETLFSDSGEGIQEWSDAPYSDNARCLEGEAVKTDAISAHINQLGIGADDGAQVLSCATVDLDRSGGSGSGPGSFLLGLILVCAAFSITPKRHDFFV